MSLSREPDQRRSSRRGNKRSLQQFVELGYDCMTYDDSGDD